MGRARGHHCRRILSGPASGSPSRDKSKSAASPSPMRQTQLAFRCSQILYRSLRPGSKGGVLATASRQAQGMTSRTLLQCARSSRNHEKGKLPKRMKNDLPAAMWQAKRSRARKGCKVHQARLEAVAPRKFYSKTIAKIRGVYELLRKRWSERRDSNPRHSRWQRDALPG